ncbi:MAG: hypothetical protein EOR30_27695 [Mesorhizobium sp.]|uniref:hypothetical protein n=1 Tax=Mesorhizobium sp. TaxID=1871066 RepID=UPI000FE5CE8C|nr:hypothetical protein [Mesorhizobium sp.]RWF86840.1 MAG: hypothetical protein EOQ36_15745 [Mesorhizobium sp.]RWF86852.1 MAG: hypothetical protein EOQ45_33690 [Mesorhizobium sp.]RWJ45230.1 MAG: hypothetical protein EOR30_27695 [Mesorhizobium sp.]RWJ58216.1 MAG: hypothetical protein EOR32_26975 [Mesorhizobium sp.]RWJ59230.1 MAG: hypothetical protein EOR34_36275 [Mesorhizobium sp.]
MAILIEQADWHRNHLEACLSFSWGWPIGLHHMHDTALIVRIPSARGGSVSGTTEPAKGRNVS